MAVRRAAIFEEYRSKVRDPTEELVFFTHQHTRNGDDLWLHLTNGLLEEDEAPRKGGGAAPARSSREELAQEAEAYLKLRRAYNKVHAFWDKVSELVAEGQLPADFLSGSGEVAGRGWLHRANHFREALEPLSIANYYRLGLHHSTGHYMAVRPAVYSLIQRNYLNWLAGQGVEQLSDSTVWAVNMECGRSNAGVAPLARRAFRQQRPGQRCGEP